MANMSEIDRARSYPLNGKIEWPKLKNIKAIRFTLSLEKAKKKKLTSKKNLPAGNNKISSNNNNNNNISNNILILIRCIKIIGIERILKKILRIKEEYFLFLNSLLFYLIFFLFQQTKSNYVNVLIIINR